MRRLQIRIVLLTSFLFILIAQDLFSQYFSIGTDPASVKWMIIKTPHFKIIYPENFGAHGLYVANGFEYIYAPETRSLDSHPRRTPVILHNRTTVANAMTPYAPRRIEFFTSPPQDTYAQNWIDQLMIHEFRHSAQYGAVDRGFTRVMSYIFGQQAIPAIVGLFVPFWFIEGDATVTETATSHSGRGRVPSFEMHLRAQLLQKKIWSYDKAVNGSFLDKIPDRYELGYQLVGMTREQYGEQVWANVLKNVGRYPFMIVPFAASLKHQTGFGKRKLYRSMAEKLQKKWSAEDEEWKREDGEWSKEDGGWRMEGGKLSVETESGYIKNPVHRKYFTSYKLPVALNDSMILAERSSLNDLSSIVILNKQKKEKKLLTCGTGYMGESLSTDGSILYWSEQVQDPRWELRDYRVIKAIDIHSGKRTQLTHCSRLYSPAVSPGGKMIAAVEVRQDNSYFLLILDAGTGHMLKKITTADNLLFIHPSWSEDGKWIVSAVLGKSGNSLVLIDPENGNTRYLIPFSYDEIKQPVFYHNKIIFTASFAGRDDLFATDLLTGNIFRVTHSRFGAADPSTNHSTGELMFAAYTADGYNVVSEKTDTTRWEPFHPAAQTHFPLAEKLAEEEHFIFSPDSVPSHQYPEKRYHKALQLFNLHSWAPLNVDISNTKVYPGVMLFSQNLLSSSTLTAGYSYNLNEEAGKYSLAWSYQGLYPVFDLAADYGLRRTWYYIWDKQTLAVKWNEFNVSLNMSLPLKWTHNQWYQGVRPKVGAAWKNINRDIPFAYGIMIDRNFLTLDYSLNIYNQEKMSYRDLYPRWGQVAEVNYLHSPFNKYPGSVFALEGVLYFPGILKHHGIRFYSGYQYRHEIYYRFSDFITYPRGYDNIYETKVLSLSLNYAMPLFYPDLSLGPVIYIKRVKATLFYDYARFFTMPGTHIQSAGMDLTADFHLFGHFIPFEAGLRSVYKPDVQQFVFQFLFNINLSGF